MRLSPKLIFGVLLAVAVFVFFSLAQEMNRRLQIQREASRLEQEAQQLEKRITELENLNQYFRTSAFQERMAREKLNYKAEGEKVVLISDPPHVEVVPPENNARQVPLSTLLRWWHAFFGDQGLLEPEASL